MDASPDPTEPARAEEAATQALPMVRRTTFEARKPTVIRAVARRAAAALPELGREGGAQPIPRSARATVDRRRRAAREAAAARGGAETRSAPAADSPAPEAAKQVSDPVEPAAAPDPVDTPTGREPTGQDPTGQESTNQEPPRHEPPVHEPTYQESPGNDPADDGPAVVAGEAAAPEGSMGGDLASEEPAPPTVAAPAGGEVPSVGAATGVVPVPPPTPARHRRDDDDVLVPGRMPTPVGAAPMGRAAARTDEWAAIGQETVALPAIDEAGGRGVREGPRAGGPSVLEADSWDADIETGLRSDSYHGRRRARSRFSWVWLLVALVVAVLVGVVTVPYLFGGPTSNVAPPPTSPQPIAVAPSPPTELAATSSPPASPTPSPTTRTTRAAPPPPPPPSTTSAPPAFAPVTFEGEAVGFGGAKPVPFPGASGGRVADHLGEWPGPGPDGEIRFEVTVPAAGAYTLTVTYVFVGPVGPGDDTRWMRVRVNGETLPDQVEFGRVTQCCETKSIPLTLQAGVNSIRLFHNDRRMPAVDKVVITQA
ncbi:MAG TPA: hypothetical protein VK028_07080 [Micromonosporaceae bacterium]|nr:hypothetical protein [Micromonosporaceae bacterium]